MKVIKISLKIFKFIFIGILAIILLLNFINIFKRVVSKEQLPLVFGYGSALIVTGSMEPAIMPGDMVVIHEQDDYEPGDIVTYHGNNSPITHRILERTPNGYITQGDANNKDDGEIEKSRIVGRVVRTIPGVGNVILFFQSPPGILILVAGLFVIIELPRLIEKIRSNYKENKKREQESI